MLRIVGTFIAWDICKHIMGIYAYIKEPDRTPFFDQPILDQVVLTWLHQLEAFCVINLPYQIGAYLTVAPGFQERSDWPPLFGNTSDAYLVSKAWGRTWHQLLRRSLGVFTPYVQNWLGATSRKSKRTVSLLCSFSMSGLIHWSGALNNPWTPTSHGLFTYFIMQAPVIRIEDYVIDWGKARGFKGNRKICMSTCNINTDSDRSVIKNCRLRLDICLDILFHAICSSVSVRERCTQTS